MSLKEVKQLQLEICSRCLSQGPDQGTICDNCTFRMNIFHREKWPGFCHKLFWWHQQKGGILYLSCLLKLFKGKLAEHVCYTPVCFEWHESIKSRLEHAPLAVLWSGKSNGLWLMAQTESGGKNSVLFWQPFPASFELFTCEVWNVVKLQLTVTKVTKVKWLTRCSYKASWPW